VPGLIDFGDVRHSDEFEESPPKRRRHGSICSEQSIIGAHEEPETQRDSLES